MWTRLKQILATRTARILNFPLDELSSLRNRYEQTENEKQLLELKIRTLRQEKADLEVRLDATEKELAAAKKSSAQADKVALETLATKNEMEKLFKSQVESLEKMVDGLSSAYLRRSIFGHQPQEEPKKPSPPIPQLSRSGYLLQSQRTAKIRQELLKEGFERFNITPSPEAREKDLISNG